MKSNLLFSLLGMLGLCCGSIESAQAKHFKYEGHIRGRKDLLVLRLDVTDRSTDRVIGTGSAEYKKKRVQFDICRYPSDSEKRTIYLLRPLTGDVNQFAAFYLFVGDSWASISGFFEFFKPRLIGVGMENNDFDGDFIADNSDPIGDFQILPMKVDTPIGDDSDRFSYGLNDSSSDKPYRGAAPSAAINSSSYNPKDPFWKTHNPSCLAWDDGAWSDLCTDGGGNGYNISSGTYLGASPKVAANRKDFNPSDPIWKTHDPYCAEIDADGAWRDACHPSIEF